MTKKDAIGYLEWMRRDAYLKKEFNDALLMAISALQESERKWISCSERLPGLGQRVLLSKDGFISVGQLVRRGRGSQYEWSCNYNNWEGWMPLPEPFREEGEK